MVEPFAAASGLSPGPRGGSGKGDRRERSILDAAESLLADHGYEQTTVEQIARGAGITRSSLYHYFDSKQAVMTAVVERALTPLADFESEIGTWGDNPAAAIADGLEITASLWRDHTPVMLFAAQHAHTIPEVGRHWQANLNLSRAAVAEILVSGGVSEAGTPSADDLAGVIVAMVERSFWNLHSRHHTPEAEIALIATLAEVCKAAMPATQKV
jgi:AcrR family transcriptional regulator